MNIIIRFAILLFVFASSLAFAQIKIALQPVSDTVCEGSSGGFTLRASGTSLVYQWQKLNTAKNVFEDIADGNGYKGYNAPTLTIDSKTNPSAGGDYRCFIKDNAGNSIYSNVVSFKIDLYPSAKTQIPNDSVCYDPQIFVEIPKTVPGYVYTVTYFQPASTFLYSQTATGKGDTLIFDFYGPSLGTGLKKFVVKIKNNNCETQLDTLKYLISSPPNDIPVTGTRICQGQDSSRVILTRTTSGVKYQAFLNGSPISKILDGTDGNDSLRFLSKNFAVSTQTISVIANNAGCSLLLTQKGSIIVSARPSVTAISNSPLCSGDTLKLNIKETLKASYSWTNSGKFNSTIVNPTVVNPVADKYTVVATVNGCSDTSFTTVVINPRPTLPVIDGPKNVCRGNTAVGYSVTKVTGITYLWIYDNSSGVAMTGANTESVKINFLNTAVSDTLRLIATNASKCSITAKYYINVGAGPTTTVNKSTVTLCEGDSIKLQANPVIQTNSLPVYSWSGPNLPANTNGANVKAGLATTNARYFVTYSNNICTGDVDTIDVVVNSKPKPGFSYGKGLVCEKGADLVPSPKPIAGSNFTRTDGSKLKLSFDQFSGVISVKNSDAGTFTIKNTVTDANKCSADTSVTVIINPKPAAPLIKGGCQSGATATLSIDISNPPLTVTWFRNNTKIGNGQSISATPGAVYKALVNTAAGCFSDTAAINPFATKPDILILKGDSTFCTGDSVVLASNSPTGNSWMNLDGGLISNAQSIVVKTSGTITLNVSNGNCSGSDSKIVTVNNYPLAGTINSNPQAASSICPGKSVMLFNSNTQVSNIQWVKDGIDMKDSVKTLIIVKQPGAYQIKTSNKGCNSFSAVKNISLNPVTVPVLTYKGTQNICQGEILNVNINNFVSGLDQWYASSQPLTDNNSKLQVYPVSQAGIYYKVVRTSPQQCVTVSDSVIVKVNQVPVVSLISTIDSICKGGKVLYTASESTANPNVKFQWFVNNTLVPSVTGKTLRIDTLTKQGIVKASVLYTGLCLSPSTISKTAITYIKKPVSIIAAVSQPTCFNKNGRITLSPSTT